jgi:hypothetical protein
MKRGAAKKSSFGIAALQLRLRQHGSSASGRSRNVMHKASEKGTGVFLVKSQKTAFSELFFK